jgi:alanyl-tRNA synthetase
VLLKKVVDNEEERFRETLENGLTILAQKISRMKKNKEMVIDGDFIFKLYDTYGFPVDIVRDISLERKVGFDEAGFNRAMEKQRAKSRASQKGEGIRLHDDGVKRLLESGRRTEFIGYDKLVAETTGDTLLDINGHEVDKLMAGDSGRLFTPMTPFYAESGGQVGDVGTVLWEGGRATVLSTFSEGAVFFHQIGIEEGVLVPGQRITLSVSETSRAETAANHTSTHLLQAAMKHILGEHIKQAGSLVGPQRLRFDFTHFSPLSTEEITAIEQFVNEHVRANLEVKTRILAREDAVREGATALFGEKYGDFVRVVTAGECSKELCGGTHVKATGDIGLFMILSESGIASGVRRIEALTGRAAFDPPDTRCNSALGKNHEKTYVTGGLYMRTAA